MADHKDAIGELLNSAEKVISAYDPSDAVKHDANVAKIMKFNAAHLEATAEYLGFTVKDTADKKLYKNLGGPMAIFAIFAIQNSGKTGKMAKN